MNVPNINDFTTVEAPENDRDSFCAWQHSGGRTVAEAYDLFQTNPEYYQEGFMFMGDTAFMYCFPALRRFLREDEPKPECDGAAWIVAGAILQHISPCPPALAASFPVDMATPPA